MYLIIVNPNASRGLSILRLPVLTSILDSRLIPYEVHITTKPNDACVQTLAFLRRSTCMGIIGLGGDGTMQEIVTALLEMFPVARRGGKIPIPLGILPTGSCNDFISTLEGEKYSPKRRYEPEPEAVIARFVDRVVSRDLMPIDVLTANDQAFINVGHVGIDTFSAILSQKYRQKYNEFAYWIATYEGILKYRPISLTFETETVKHGGRYALFTVCNGKYYGFGAKISPTAELDDGIMNITAAGAMSRFGMLVALHKIALNKTEKIKNIRFLECKELKLAVPVTTLCLDGNFYPVEGDVHFKVLPKALYLFA